MNRSIIFALLAIMWLVGCGPDERSKVPSEQPTPSQPPAIVWSEDPKLAASDASPSRDPSRENPRDESLHDESFRADQPEFSLNPQRLKANGIRAIHSERLILLTDSAGDDVDGFPSLVDQLYDHLERVWGARRPEPSGRPFRVVGCLMQNADAFRAAGLLPPEAVDMRHGRQMGYQIWLRDQNEDYYCRHLLLHEFVHAFMTCEVPAVDLPERWFAEAAAEFMATHTTTPQVGFGVLPAATTDFEGWGRISAIRRRREIRSDDSIWTKVPSLTNVVLQKGFGSEDDDGYHWWWALGWLLSQHPDYSAVWHDWCVDSRGSHVREGLQELLLRHPQLSSDWLLFVECVCEGFQAPDGFVVHRAEAAEELELDASRSWQDTGWNLSAGQAVTVECTGRCVVHRTSADWVSEPNGITLEYDHGHPRGRALAILVSEDQTTVSQRIAIGPRATINPTTACRLWLQINDSAAQRSENSGGYRVRIRRTSSSEE